MIKAVIFDLDGTLYLGDSAIDGAAETLKKLRGSGVKTLFLTNAATTSRDRIVKRLAKMGLETKKEEVYASCFFLARYLKENKEGKKMFVVGEQGILDEFDELGVKHVEENSDIVVVGLDRSFTYEKLSKALTELNKGAELIVTNRDPSFPTEEGLRPGAGSLVAAIEAASGKEGYAVGKPNCYALEVIKKDYDLSNGEMLIVGDRLDTDIKFAKECGIKSALVLTGVSKKSDIKEIVPDYVFQSIADFSLP